MSPKPWTVGELLKVTTDYFKQKNIDSPRLSAEILLSLQLHQDRVHLYLNFDQPLNDKEVAGYRALVKRRLGREPIQYIAGVQEFWSLEFTVGPEVLIPRSETEVLVEHVSTLFKEKKVSDRPTLLDLGTGCGAIAVALAREIPAARIWASDISEGALRIARLNAEKHCASHRIIFVNGDMFRPFAGQNLSFEMIVSNPPYIASDMFDSLLPEVRDHEPRLALDGGEKGMFYIKKIIEEAPGYLNQGGWILMEMDPNQTSTAADLMEKTGWWDPPCRIKDYSHRYRVVMARKK